MENVEKYMSLFFRRARGQLTGIVASYVDDTLSCGDKSFSKLTEKTPDHSEVKDRKHTNMRLSGVYIDKTDNGHEIHQQPITRDFDKHDRHSAGWYIQDRTYVSW